MTKAQYLFACTHNSDGSKHQIACTAVSEQAARTAIPTCWDVSVCELINVRAAHYLLCEVVA
jgi:hypothetical protein